MNKKKFPKPIDWKKYIKKINYKFIIKTFLVYVSLTLLCIGGFYFTAKYIYQGKISYLFNLPLSIIYGILLGAAFIGQAIWFTQTYFNKDTK